MPLQWTESADVTKRWIGDDPLPATPEQIETLLEDAEDTILREFPDVAERIAATPPTLTEARVKKVASRMVLRFLRNPEGFRTATETTGPFSENRTFTGNAPGEIVLTDEDRADLADGSGRKRAFTINASPNGSALYVDPLLAWGPGYAWGLG